MKLYHITHKNNLESILEKGIKSMHNRTSCFSSSTSYKKYNHLGYQSPIFLTGDVDYAIKRMGSWNKMEDLVIIEVEIPCGELYETENDFELIYNGDISPDKIISHNTEIPNYLNMYWVK